MKDVKEFWKRVIPVGKQAKGALILDGKHVADTLRCVHCSAHWIAVKGSGIRRGFCTSCRGVTCGSVKCDICIPLETRLEGWEKNKPLRQVLRDLERKKIFI